MRSELGASMGWLTVTSVSLCGQGTGSHKITIGVWD